MKPPTEKSPGIERSLAQRSLLLLLLMSPLLGAKDIHVSPEGESGNVGTSQSPLKSVTEARDLVRAWSAKHPGDNCRVLLHSGTHDLADTLVLDSRDSGTTFLGEKGAILCGGTVLKLRSVLENGDWAMSLPNGSLPEQLYVNGGWAMIARAPDMDEQEPFLTFQSLEHNEPSNGAAESFSTRTVFILNGKLPDNFPSSDFTVAVMKSWSLFRQKVASVEGSSLILPNPTWLDNNTSGGQSPNIFSSNESKHYRAWLEGHPTFISKPGEWGVDAEKRELVYRPREGETPDTTRLVIPRLSQLVRIEGTAEKPVRNLGFDNISFQHSADFLPAEGLDTRQAGASYLDYYQRIADRNPDFEEGKRSGFFATHLHGGKISACQFTSMGKHGLQVGSGCKDVVIEGCRFEDCGGGGALIGTSLDPENEANQARDIHLTDSFVQHIGRTWAGSIGIWQGFAKDCEIAHNRVKELPYSGISMGWQWDDKPTMAENNRIHHNHVSDIMKLLGDGGGIYVLGRQPNSIIEANLVHGVHRSEYNHGAPNNGIYPDQGSTGITITKNIVYDIASSPVRCHRAGGMNVSIIDNILVPSTGDSAGSLSPPYGGDILFQKSTEELTDQVIWKKNTILTPEQWDTEKAGLLDKSKYGPRGKWRGIYETK